MQTWPPAWAAYLAGSLKKAGYDDVHFLDAMTNDLSDEALFERMRDYPDYRLHLAEIDGRLAGTFALLIMDNLGECGTPSGVVEDVVVEPALQRSGVSPDGVDEVIMGNVLQAGLGQNTASQAQIGAGIPPEAGAFTVNKVCASGMKAVELAAQAVATIITMVR